LHLKIIDPAAAVDNYVKWSKSFDDAVTKKAR